MKYYSNCNQLIQSHFVIGTDNKSSTGSTSELDFGRPDVLFTPAYWKEQVQLICDCQTESTSFQLGSNIIEEISVCLLGGFGMKAELCLEAFNRLKRKGLVRKGTTLSKIKAELSKPFLINGKKMKYRFVNQKSNYLALFYGRKDLNNIPVGNDLDLRKWLIDIDGIGPKTASWITRNWLQSDNVAILDIHIYRACVIAGVFKKGELNKTCYFDLENRYLQFANDIDVRPSLLDAVIWEQMKAAGALGINIYNNH